MQRDRATFLGKPVAGDRALIMAIVNRTPDSFYDRGATFTDEAAKEAVMKDITAVREKLRPLQRTKMHTHGWVWLYLRR